MKIEDYDLARLAIPLLVVITGLVAAAPAHAAAPAVSGQLLVGFKQGVSKDRQGQVLAGLDGRVAQRFGAISGGRLALVRPRSGKATDALLKRLEGSPRRGVRGAGLHPVRVRRPRCPNDPFYQRD